MTKVSRLVAALALVVVAASAAAWTLAPVLALAQTVTLPATAPSAEAPPVVFVAPATGIDLTQLALAALPIVGGVFILVLRQVVLRIASAMGIGNAAALMQQLDPIAQQGLAYAQAQLQQRIAEKGLTVDIKSAIVRQAAAYVSDHATAQLKAGNYDGAKLAQKLEAMISLNTTPPEQSVAVPTPPAPPATT